LIGSRIEATNLNVVWAKVLALKGVTTNRDITLPVVELAYPSSDGEIAFAATFTLDDLGKMLAAMSDEQKKLVQRVDQIESTRGPVVAERQSRTDQKPYTDDYYSADEEEERPAPAPKSILTSRSSSMVRNRSSSSSGRNARVTTTSQAMLYALEDAVLRGCSEAQIIRVLDSLVPGRERGPDQPTAQMRKAETIREAMPYYWKTYFTDDQLIDWIIDNGYRGASAMQNQAMRMNNKKLPPSGVNNKFELPTPEPVKLEGYPDLPQFDDYKLNLRWNNFVRSNSGLVARHPDFIEVAYDVVRAKDNLPDADEMAAIKQSLDTSRMKLMPKKRASTSAAAILEKYKNRSAQDSYQSRASQFQSSYFDIGNRSEDL